MIRGERRIRSSGKLKTCLHPFPDREFVHRVGDEFLCETGEGGAAAETVRSARPECDVEAMAEGITAALAVQRACAFILPDSW